MTIDYKRKYLKYKEKYLNFGNKMYGGGTPHKSPHPQLEDGELAAQLIYELRESIFKSEIPEITEATQYNPDYITLLETLKVYDRNKTDYTKAETDKTQAEKNIAEKNTVVEAAKNTLDTAVTNKLDTATEEIDKAKNALETAAKEKVAAAKAVSAKAVAAKAVAAKA